MVPALLLPMVSVSATTRNNSALVSPKLSLGLPPATPSVIGRPKVIGVSVTLLPRMPRP